MARCPSIDTKISLISPAAAAILLGISQSTLKRMRLRGDGPKIIRFTSRTFRYRLSDIEDWLVGQAISRAKNREQTNEYQNWQLAARKRALEIVESEGIINEFGCINVDRSHTGGRPCFGHAGKKITISQAIAMPAKGLHTRHLCNNEACINPDHLVVGTPSENTLDAYEFGTLQRGGGHPRAVQLTQEQISAIRADRRSQAAIGREWVIAQSTVGQIKRREGRWANDASMVNANMPATFCLVGDTSDNEQSVVSQEGDAALAEGSDQRRTTGAGG